MTSVVDVWRGVDPDARLVSGSLDLLARPVRGVLRTRAAPPHLPPTVEGELLVVDPALFAGGLLDPLLTALDEAGLRPVGLLLAGVARPAELERGGGELPVLASGSTAVELESAVAHYLELETSALAELATELRLAAAEAALADPTPAAPAGVVASRMRRGVAVAVNGRLRSLNPRPAGQALAARFAAAFGRLLAGGEAPGPARRTRDGLWLLGRRLGPPAGPAHGPSAGPNAEAWLFDDVPFARADEAALDALAVTLRALLRRPAREAEAVAQPQRRQPPSTGDALRDTLLAVARANGRIAPAARALGVHRNTVLYRLRRARAERGIDPRRPEDALRLLRDADRHGP